MGLLAEAGLNVTVTIGSLIQTTVSEAGGDYRVTFINSAGGVASSSDTVIVQVGRQSTGESGSKTVQLSAEQIFASRATIDLQFSSAIGEYLLSVPAGISLIHVPLKVAAVDGVAKTITSIADLYDALGGADTVNFLITYDPQAQDWLSYLAPSDKGTAVDKGLTDDIWNYCRYKSPGLPPSEREPARDQRKQHHHLKPGYQPCGGAIERLKNKPCERPTST